MLKMHIIYLISCFKQFPITISMFDFVFIVSLIHIWRYSFNQISYLMFFKTVVADVFFAKLSMLICIFPVHII